MSWPKLFGLPSNKVGIKQWTICVSLTDDSCSIIRTHGLVDGKQQQSIKMVESKNKGKKNETTPLEQANKEANSLFKKQKEKGYIEDIDKIKTNEVSVKLPMLAHDFQKRSKDIKGNCYVQPKIDGVRLLAINTENSLSFVSRTGKHITNLLHVEEDIKKIGLKDGEYLDGELFSFDISFEEICGLFRKTKLTIDDKTKLAKLKFHIFDFIDESDMSLTFEQRQTKITNIFTESYPSLHRVETILVDKSKIENQLQTYLTLGYEGLIVRNPEGPYVFNHRSKDLQKLKLFQDAEYKIIGVKEATGNDKGTGVLICCDESGKEFAVRPRGTREYRKDLLCNFDNYKSKFLTVRFQNLSSQNIPRFGVGITIRDYE
jgi:DNA ligase-1